jgi:hypothetical protein
MAEKHDLVRLTHSREHLIGMLRRPKNNADAIRFGHSRPNVMPLHLCGPQLARGVAVAICVRSSLVSLPTTDAESRL